MMNRCIVGILLMFVLGSVVSGACASDWATQVVSYSNLSPNEPYDDPAAALGRPTTLIEDMGFWPIAPGSVFNCSIVYGPYNVSPNGEKLVVTVLSGGEMTVRFDSPIYDDPANWYGKDLIVFGNSAFSSVGYVYPDTNMETMRISSGPGGIWEQATVSVSQNGVDWFTFDSGPFADNFAPTQMCAWDWVENNWGSETDYTRPLPASLAVTDFSSLYVADAIDLYKGSAGGTAFDISGLPLNVDATGLKWIQYVKVEGDAVELDAVTRVSHAVSSISIGKAKTLPDGTPVILDDAVVSAATYETGRCCYVQDIANRCGIRMLGRVLSRGDEVKIYGEIATVDGERVIKPVSVELQGTDSEIKALAMTNRSLAFGLSTTGMLVKIWGKVVSGDDETKSFVIDDGSGIGVNCVGPRTRPSDVDPANPTNPDWGVAPDDLFELPAVNSVVSATGISSCESGAQVVRLRDIEDVGLMHD